MRGEAEQLWFFKHENWGDEWQKFDGIAWDHEDVARTLAEQDYSEEPCEPRHFEFVVEVRKGTDGEVKKVDVSAEASVDFYAREIAE